jgi:hypothetical protein
MIIPALDEINVEVEVGVGVVARGEEAGAGERS